MGLFSDSDQYEGNLTARGSRSKGLYLFQGEYLLEVQKLSVKDNDGRLMYIATFKVIESDNPKVKVGAEISQTFTKSSKKYAELFYGQLYDFLSKLMGLDDLNDVRKDHIYQSIGAYDEHGDVIDFELEEGEESEFEKQPFKGVQIAAEVVHRSKYTSNGDVIPGTEPGSGKEKMEVIFSPAA